MCLQPTDLSINEEEKVVKPWIGPYKVKERLGRVEYVTESEFGGRPVRAQANRLRSIGKNVKEAKDHSDSVLPDLLRALEKTPGVK